MATCLLYLDDMFIPSLMPVEHFSFNMPDSGNGIVRHGV